jgi:hypothetical protein
MLRISSDCKDISSTAFADFPAVAAFPTRNAITLF